MQFLHETKFRARWFFPITKEIEHGEWRDTIPEVKLYLKMCKRYDAFDYIENERGVVAFPTKIDVSFSATV